jgi:hypothetical protein
MVFKWIHSDWMASAMLNTLVCVLLALVYLFDAECVSIFVAFLQAALTVSSFSNRTACVNVAGSCFSTFE